MSDASSLAPIAAEPSRGEQAAAFIAAQLAGDFGASIQERRIVLLGSLPRPPVTAVCALPGRFAWDERVRLCARLLRSGVQLVLLDSPRSRLLIEALLPLAADGHGRWQGGCLLERDLSTACRDAAALLVLPGWRQPPSLPWRALAGRMRPQALMFDLRRDPAQPPPDASGLRVWRMGVCAVWG